MDTFGPALEKLTMLLNMGHIDQAEFDKRRQKMVDEFIGRPGPNTPARATAGGMGRSTGLSTGYTPPATMLGQGGHKPGKALGTRGPYTNFGGAAGAGGMQRFSPYGMGMGMGMPMGMGMGMGGFGFGGFGYPGVGGFGGFGGYGGKGKGKTKVGSTAVKVQPVPHGIEAEELRASFMHFGNAINAVIKEGMPRHGYVNFSSPEEATLAAASGSIQLRGQFCSVILSWKQKPPTAEGEPTNGIGIFNIPFQMTQEELNNMMMAYPGFQILKMVTNKNGEFRGYAFAYFDSVENAMYAKSNILGLQIGDQTLDCKFSNRTYEEVMAAAVQ